MCTHIHTHSSRGYLQEQSPLSRQSSSLLASHRSAYCSLALLYGRNTRGAHFRAAPLSANRAKNIKFARYESVCENDRRVVTFTYKFTSLPVAFANNNRARERRCTESRASLARIVVAAVELQTLRALNGMYIKY